MQKDLYIIKENVPVARDTYRMKLSCPALPELHGGQFVDILLDGFYLRRPISVSDVSEDGLTILYKVVGEGTAMMAGMTAGESLDVLAPLGHGFDLDRCKSAALLVGGGLGAAPMYLLARELLARGRRVNVVLGFNRADEIVLYDEFRSLGIEPMIATMDGSVGVKGFVTDAIEQYKPEFDIFYTCGPLPMMKALCSAVSQPGQASLEERMGCGAGFCYGCTCHSRNGAKRICKDGPVFDKEDIIW